MAGLLSLDPLTANPGMLAQAAKARLQPRKQLQGQGLLDAAAIGLSPVPVIGDVLGLGADASRFYNEPESRTPLNFGLAALGLLPFVPPLVSAGLGKFAQAQGKTISNLPTGPARNQAGAIVYHGSPHKFDQFDSSKIGTGEGAQAYGHGLYFAESPDVAKSYQENLAFYKDSDPKKWIVDGRQSSPTPEDSAAILTAKFGKENALAKLQNLLDQSLNFGGKRSGDYQANLQNQIDLIKSGNIKQAVENKGSLYKVDLPDEAIAKMLDWDKPLSQQSKEVRNALNKIGTDLELGSNIGSKDWMPQDFLTALRNWDTKTKTMRNGKIDASAASQELRGSGIPGIRYLDGGSRGSGQGTSNYVVFPGNEGLLKILERQ